MRDLRDGTRHHPGGHSQPERPRRQRRTSRPAAAPLPCPTPSWPCALVHRQSQKEVSPFAQALTMVSDGSPAPRMPCVHWVQLLAVQAPSFFIGYRPATSKFRLFSRRLQFPAGSATSFTSFSGGTTQVVRRGSWECRCNRDPQFYSGFFRFFSPSLSPPPRSLCYFFSFFFPLSTSSFCESTHLYDPSSILFRNCFILM